MDVHTDQEVGRESFYLCHYYSIICITAIIFVFFFAGNSHGHVSRLAMESPQSLFAQGDEDLQVMKAGAMLRKVKSRSWKKQRHFRLQEDGQTIWYKSRWAGTGHSTFSVADVDVVREGHQSEILLSIADEFPADLCFTLVFRGRRSNLDLVAESPSEAQVWIRGVRKLIQNTKSMNDKERLDQWIWDWFQKADKNKDGRMNFKEVRTLLKMMNVDMNEEYTLRLFTMADNSESGCLENEEFVQFYKMLTEREDVWRVFQDYSRDGQILTLAELEDFLKQEQQEGERSLEHAQELIDRYEPSENGKDHCATVKEKVYCPKWQVALNFQTAGPEMDLNDGLFSQNGCCGYVLKPDFMRNDDSFDPERPQDRNGYTSLRLSIQVISGQQLPKVNHKEGSIVDPLVRVEIYGVFQDQAKQETSYIDNNGFNPLWNETLNFIVHVPELALVRFVVEDYDKSSRNDFMGQFTVPFTCIQPGYRHIHLLSKDGTAIPLSSLFVNIKISELTTEV
ncbi:unnamed protein product [Oncorhynchus mykiss]|uniref:phosphoinositide phospholipase C n=1 Tax=Oncorhynchus mykiss TaxID=8022 RepID=A0A060VYB0_ONCMY|nr:unnamed protein product [Oncorhynchus mykiss]